MDLAFAPRQIEFWPIERLHPYARNAKMHGADQVARIAASMARFGWTVPCIVGYDCDELADPARLLWQPLERREPDGILAPLGDAPG